MSDAANYVDPTVSEDEDNGTMPENVATLADHVLGHRIVKAEIGTAEIPWYPGCDWRDRKRTTLLTLDTGDVVRLADSDDCCAYTEMEGVIQRLPDLDHIITSVTTTDGYTRWHILADLGEVLELQVDWSPGNAFYYAYGFHIDVERAGEEA